MPVGGQAVFDEIAFVACGSCVSLVCSPEALTLGLIVCVFFFFQVFNNHFFQVTIDDLRPEPSKLSMLCHADSLGILPVQWCLKNGVSLTPPKGSCAVEIRRSR